MPPRSPGPLAILGPLLAAGLLTFGAGEAAACSGPGAARTILISGQIGLAFGGGSFALVLAGGAVLMRRGQPWRIPLIAVMLGLQPVLWIATNRGDCGFALRSMAGAMFLVTTVVVALALAWPGRGPAGRWRWRLSGGLAGLLIGLPVVAVDLGSAFTPSVTLASLVLTSMTISGALVGERARREQLDGRPSRSFGLKTLLLLPILLAPNLALLLPVRPYEAAISQPGPFRFIAVAAATGRPIPGASIRVVDPRFPEDDRDQQYPAAVTSADGGADAFMAANVRGRAGLLGRTETTTYHPLFVRAEAPGYRPFAAALASDPPSARPDLTDPPLGMTFPPPASVTIRLRSANSAADH